MNTKQTRRKMVFHCMMVEIATMCLDYAPCEHRLSQG